MMKDAFEISNEIKLRFEANKTEENLCMYVMAELLTPIEDKYHAMDLIRDNIAIVTDNRLLYLGAEISAGWNPGDQFFLNILDQKLPTATEEEKAIIYYLNAIEISPYSALRDPVCMEQYRSCLQKSVACSSNMYFAYNRSDLAAISPKREAVKLLQEGKETVRCILSEADYKSDSHNELDIQNYIDEFILGISIPEIIYEMHFGPEAFADIMSK